MLSKDFRIFFIFIAWQSKALQKTVDCDMSPLIKYKLKCRARRAVSLSFPAKELLSSHRIAHNGLFEAVQKAKN